jgi:hypothetical protein
MLYDGKSFAINQASGILDIIDTNRLPFASSLQSQRTNQFVQMELANTLQSLPDSQADLTNCELSNLLVS